MEPKSNKPFQLSKKDKSPRKERGGRAKARPAIQEVIDLDAVHEGKTNQAADLFMDDISRRCNSFFNWISDTRSMLLAENLWKQEKVIYAAQRFPLLNNNELMRLVDRDWRYMAEDDRNRIVQQYSRCPSQAELEKALDESGWLSKA